MAMDAGKGQELNLLFGWICALQA